MCTFNIFNKIRTFEAISSIHQFANGLRVTFSKIHTLRNMVCTAQMVELPIYGPWVRDSGLSDYVLCGRKRTLSLFLMKRCRFLTNNGRVPIFKRRNIATVTYRRYITEILFFSFLGRLVSFKDQLLHTCTITNQHKCHSHTGHQICLQAPTLSRHIDPVLRFP